MAIPPRTALDARAKRQLGLTLLSVSGLSVWLLDLGAVYAVSTHECDVPRASWALMATGSMLTAAALAYAASQRHAEDRQHAFLAQLALMLNALALLLLLGFAAPLAMLRPCE